MSFIASFFAQRLASPMFKLMLVLLGGMAVLALLTGNIVMVLLIIPHMLGMVMVLLCMRYIFMTPFQVFGTAIGLWQKKHGQPEETEQA